MDFQSLVEGVSNPLRKERLKDVQPSIMHPKDTAKQWMDYIREGIIEDNDDQKIKDQYLKLSKHFPERAETWLNQKAKEFADKTKREKTKGYSKIHEDEGVQIFIDDLVDPEFVNDVYKMRMLKFSLKKMLKDIRGILPNRKPKFVITNALKNPRFKSSYTTTSVAIYYDKLIFIDENSIDDPDIFIHEYAHYLADSIPTQTEPILQKAYNEMLDFYWRRAKKKKRSLQGDSSDPISMNETKKWRDKISAKLGFPQYGLTNFDEFFAVLIENWHKLPNNAATYRFKSMVKNVINRF